MTRPGPIFLLSLVVAVGSCGRPSRDEPLAPPATDGAPATGASAPEAPAAPVPATASPAPPTDKVNDGFPDLTPAPLAPEAERSEKGARNVLLAWARALELKEFDQARAMLSEADRAKWSPAEWRDLFAGLDHIAVTVPDGTIEGAAGSSFYTSRVEMTALARGGRPVRFEGPAVLRRVNDVPGATPEQLHWHFESIALDWTH